MLSDECKALQERWQLADAFSLPSDSTVVIVGAYKGLAMELIDELYHPKYLIGYEPQDWAAAEATARIALRANCQIISNGLWAGVPEKRIVPMGEWHTDACSFINTGPNSRQQGQGVVVDGDYALRITGLPSFDLVIMNIEGYEFELIPYLMDKGWLPKFQRLAVQFHLGFGNDDDYAGLIERISETHSLRIDDRPSWVYWEKE